MCNRSTPPAGLFNPRPAALPGPPASWRSGGLVVQVRPDQPSFPGAGSLQRGTAAPITSTILQIACISPYTKPGIIKCAQGPPHRATCPARLLSTLRTHRLSLAFGQTHAGRVPSGMHPIRTVSDITTAPGRNHLDRTGTAGHHRVFNIMPCEIISKSTRRLTLLYIISIMLKGCLCVV